MNKKGRNIAFLQLMLAAMFFFFSFQTLRELKCLLSISHGLREMISLYRFENDIFVDTFCFASLCTLFLLSGTSYWLNRKIHWLFTQSSAIYLISCSLYLLLESDLLRANVSFIIAVILIVSFIVLDLSFCKRKYRDKAHVKNNEIYISLFLALILFVAFGFFVLFSKSLFY